MLIVLQNNIFLKFFSWRILLVLQMHASPLLQTAWTIFIARTNLLVLVFFYFQLWPSFPLESHCPHNSILLFTFAKKKTKKNSHFCHISFLFLSHSIIYLSIFSLLSSLFLSYSILSLSIPFHPLFLSYSYPFSFYPILSFFFLSYSILSILIFPLFLSFPFILFYPSYSVLSLSILFYSLFLPCKTKPNVSVSLYSTSTSFRVFNINEISALSLSSIKQPSSESRQQWRYQHEDNNMDGNNLFILFKKKTNQ